MASVDFTFYDIGALTNYKSPIIMEIKIYFITIVDDHSQCTQIYLIQYKSKAHQLLMNAFNLIET